MIKNLFLKVTDKEYDINQTTKSEYYLDIEYCRSNPSYDIGGGAMMWYNRHDHRDVLNKLRNT